MVALREVTEALGFDPARLEPTRPGDDDSVGNGNWHLWTSDGQHHILRRYHLLRTEEDLAYETQVLDHLTRRGWCVPARVAGPVQYGGRLWGVTRFVPGKPHQDETAAQQAERGEVLARLHADLGDLALGSRPGFFQPADLDAMGEFQGWDQGVELLRRQRPDLADRAARAMDSAKELVQEYDLLGLPRRIVHGDFARWNLHFDDDGRLAGVIDFDLCHLDSCVWELVIARAQREMLAGYQRAAVAPLSEHELAAIEPLRVVFRVSMVMAELWNGRQTGRFDEAMIDRQLAAARS
ncbi:homoserine kinase type II [Kribbella sp. VKM Ac-2571]|uniref:phosphotransferase enzyme family protein n=1 Tax=Kribbella sp. VKM Ac-2571 TaxID=2512222 RepID=UPI00105FF63D|nr:phosphotransferase [Kribbella sp. VKM Ac-2571]TDO69230.1 homoserine kinase type II [Kribbella sp. VKM Ac-2571]